MDRARVPAPFVAGLVVLGVLLVAACDLVGQLATAQARAPRCQTFTPGWCHP
jgi:hypothetical protein